MLARLTALGVLLLACPVHAQAPVEKEPATAAQIEAARARVDALIAAADAGEFFVNASSDGNARATHKPSGMTCAFAGNERDRISIFPVLTDDVPRGYDVGCVSWDDELKIDVTLYATRYRPMPTEEQDIQATAAGIRQRWPDARPVDGIPVMSSGDEPPAQAVAFNVTFDGKPSVTAGFITHRGEWAFKSRVTGPREPEMLVSLYGNLALMGALPVPDSGRGD